MGQTILGTHLKRVASYCEGCCSEGLIHARSCPKQGGVKGYVVSYRAKLLYATGSLGVGTSFRDISYTV